MATYAVKLADLEAQYARLFDEIERQHNGVDYSGKLPVLRKQIEVARKNAQKFDKMRMAVEAKTLKDAAVSIVEEILEEDDPEDIAVEFIENGLGRLDWVNNWKVVKTHQDAAARVQAFLSANGYEVNPHEIVNIIDQMVQNNPGRWK